MGDVEWIAIECHEDDVISLRWWSFARRDHRLYDRDDRTIVHENEIVEWIHVIEIESFDLIPNVVGVDQLDWWILSPIDRFHWAKIQKK